MSINLNQLVQGALTESVLQHLGARVGCATEPARRVVALCAPALIGSMMNKASSLEGARALFTAIMAPSVNTHIAEELPHFVVHDEGMQTLLATSSTVDNVVASHDGIDALSERISEYTGVAAGSARALAGVVGATTLGILKRYFTQHNGHVGQLPALLGHQLPVVRANMTDAFANALGLGSVGAFLAGVASRLKAVASHLDQPSTQEAAAFPIHGETHPAIEAAATKETDHRKRWIWVANAAALALFAALVARGCSTDEKAKPVADASADASAADAVSAAAVSSVSAEAASAPALLPSKDAVASFMTDASGVSTLTTTVNSEEARQHLIDVLTAKLGAGKFHANINVDPDTRSATWLDKIDGLLPLIATPDAGVEIKGDKITLSGSAADAKLGWLDKLKALLGAGWTVDSANGAKAEAVANVADTEEACSAPAIARKLNLKPVNFRIGSNSTSAAAVAALAATAKALKECDGKAKPIQLQIAGYSDNTGNAELNLRLSQKRAEAVRSYLVRHGVSAKMLSAKGYGEANPVADNGTAAGRLANRRIEFREF